MVRAIYKNTLWLMVAEQLDVGRKENNQFTRVKKRKCTENVID